MRLNAKQFESLSIAECHLLYPVLLKNAERHFDVAEAILKIKEYGMANAHLVMCAEECIMALSVYLTGWGLPVSEIRKMTTFFSSQDSGYNVSPGVVVMGLFAQSLFKAYEHLQKKLGRLNYTEFQTAFNQIMLPSKMLELSNKYSAWWAKIEKYQEEGLYVQYNIELKTPADVTVKDYNLSFDIVYELYRNTLSIIAFTKTIPEDKRQAFLRWLQDSLQPFLKRWGSFPFNLFGK